MIDLIKRIMDFTRKKPTKEFKKDPWQIAAARYCVDNAEKGITKADLDRYLHDQSFSITPRQIGQFWDEEVVHPTGREYPRNPYLQSENENKWIPPLDLVSKITDYDELKEARRNASQASKYAMISIIIASLALIMPVVQTFFTVKQTEFANVQSIPDRIEQNRSLQEAVIFCKDNEDAVDSGLFVVSTGQSATCKDVLGREGEFLNKIRRIISP